MLYHLLAGHPPVDGESTNEILTRVIDAGAIPLAKAAPDVPADLATIVDKAMARDPEDRYRTARSLAEDLRKYQTGQLVGAHRYTPRERVRRFLRRYRLVVGIAAVAAVLLAVIGTYSVVRIVHERDRAVVAQADAEAQRAVAETRRKTAATQRAAAENLIGFMLTDLKPGLERVGRLDTLSGVAREVDGYYNQVTEVADLDGAAMTKRAEAVRTLGDVLDAAGDVAGARRSYERSLKLLQAGPTTGREVEIARVLFNLAIAIDEQGDLDGAAAALQQGHAVLASAPPGPDKELATARLHRWESVLAIKRGDLAEAEAALGRAIEHATAAVRGRPQDRAMRLELSKAHDRRVDVRRARGERDDAMVDARASLAIREELAREDPQDLPVQFGLAISWDKVFHVSRSAGQTAEAEQAAAKQIAIAEMLVRHDPKNRDWGRMLLGAAERLGDLSFDRDDFADAARKQERVVTFAQQIVDAAHADPSALYDLGSVTSKLGTRLAFAGSSERALTTLRRALAIFEDLNARFPTNVDYRMSIGKAHEARGDAYAAVADAEGARGAYEASLAIADELLRADPANAVRKIAAATLRIELGRAMANLSDRRADGIAMMNAGLATFHELQKSGDLSREAIGLLPAYEQAVKNFVYTRPGAR
jgi:tetratricopeptide (TPR) repeat protein